MFFRTKHTAGRACMQIVESRRDAGKVRQHVVATLGRLDELTASGQFERLVRSGVRFASQAMVLQPLVKPRTGAPTKTTAPWSRPSLDQEVGEGLGRTRERRDWP